MAFPREGNRVFLLRGCQVQWPLQACCLLTSDMLAHLLPFSVDGHLILALP